LQLRFEGVVLQFKNPKYLVLFKENAILVFSQSLVFAIHLGNCVSKGGQMQTNLLNNNNYKSPG